jgi:RNA recognition motif-containing protein
LPIFGFKFQLVYRYAVVAAKTYKLRGQAWVVFADVASATSAMRTMQGFPFYDKPMKLAYAKTKVGQRCIICTFSFLPKDARGEQQRFDSFTLVPQ